MDVPDEDSFLWNDKGFRKEENKKFQVYGDVRREQIELKKESRSFTYINKVKNGFLGEYDIILELREITNNYDIELLSALKKDVSLYLHIYILEREFRCTFEEIEMAVANRKREGREIPYKKPVDREINKDIDVEKLIFPDEFRPVYKLQKNIEDKIKEHNNENLFQTKFIWDFSELEVVELGKAICAMKKPKGASEKEIIESFGNFFNLKIDENTKRKKLETIKNRKGETAKFLEELSSHISTWAKE